MAGPTCLHYILFGNRGLLASLGASGAHSPVPSGRRIHGALASSPAVRLTTVWPWLGVE